MDNITPEALAYAFLSFKLDNSRPKKIKVTSEFADYLKATIPMSYNAECDACNGYYGEFIGIPLELDDTIDGYYKVEY